MAGWRDNLRKASFRGVEFFYDSGSTEAGRRVVKHEYPLRDEVYPEDMGRKAKEFSIEAYVLGAEWMKKRDELEKACDQEGVATLVHPTRGEIQVACLSCKISETTREGGMARFSMTFVEAGENKYPSTTADTMAAVDAKADAAQISVEENFDGSFSLDGSPAFVGQSAGDLMVNALDRLAGAAGEVPASIGAAMTEITSDVAPFAFTAEKGLSSGMRLYSAIGQLRSGGLGMLTNRLPFSRSVFSLMRLLSERSGSASQAYTAQSHMWTYGDDLAPVRTTTTARRQQAANQEAMTALIRRASLIEAARVSARMNFTSYDQAVATRNQLGLALDRERQNAPDPVFRALTELHAATARDITARGGNLARVTTVRAPDTLPAVVVAHRLFGDATRADELVARNRLSHPGFVPGGVDLEVLNA